MSNDFLLHALKVGSAALQALVRAKGPLDNNLIDDVSDIKGYLRQLLDRTTLTWELHVGGGDSYQSTLYMACNSPQMAATPTDELKAVLLQCE